MLEKGVAGGGKEGSFSEECKSAKIRRTNADSMISDTLKVTRARKT